MAKVEERALAGHTPRQGVTLLDVPATTAAVARSPKTREAASSDGEGIRRLAVTGQAASTSSVPTSKRHPRRQTEAVAARLMTRAAKRRADDLLQQETMQEASITPVDVTNTEEGSGPEETTDQPVGVTGRSNGGQENGVVRTTEASVAAQHAATPAPAVSRTAVTVDPTAADVSKGSTNRGRVAAPVATPNAMAVTKAANGVLSTNTSMESAMASGATPTNVLANDGSGTSGPKRVERGLRSRDDGVATAMTHPAPVAKTANAVAPAKPRRKSVRAVRDAERPCVDSAAGNQSQVSTGKKPRRSNG
ncbi:hypothetical protein PF010_g662 [Phytophthora fragariae]|uniref:Uncharacterized protein n=3 Tax=Phytophthora fragariae TaxID=53985 RepID=A0A6A3FN34_9STRA|nr:hypothetical protein PF003_g471 [Phytophthora fragariae]KAE8946622.1 hypothetical protein PF009_g3761 [Phytophthora fragariae]KAE9139234.1 hypothetical protein PF010_g662 [Phytophthora fragariae]KAE9222603.1 hypothetical protein PF004_g12748 [Phytophthora fragariae]KAE9255448.1 hypothetical protein PF002_g2329 [Phytophthora fragariae]